MLKLRGPIASWTLVGAAYAALTVTFMWPVVTHLQSAWPHDAGDPALATSILSWNARVVPLTQAWRDAPIFWPVHGALAFSEHFLGISVLTTPLLWSGAGALTAYNVAFLVSFLLSALAAHALAFACVKRHDAAAVAGCVFGFSPYRLTELPHLQLLWAFGMPLALMALHRFVETRERRWILILGVAWLAQAAASGYYMLFFPVLVAAWLLWFVREPRRVVPIAATCALFALPLLPLLWIYARVHAAMGMTRSINEIEAYSADMTALFMASPDLVVWHRVLASAPSESLLFPGALALLLIAAGVIAGRAHAAVADTIAWRRVRMSALTVGLGFVAVAVGLPLFGPWALQAGSVTIASATTIDKPLSVAIALFVVAGLATPAFRAAWRQRSALAFYVCASVATFVLCLGPRPTLAGTHVLYQAPYAWLMELPGFSEVRVPARFGMLFVLCVAAAAAIAFARLTATLSRRSQRALAAVAIAVVLVEGWPRVTLAEPAGPMAPLRGVASDVPLLELPAGIVERDVAAMYRAIEHRHPLVNGYSGYDPAHYQVLKIGLAQNDGAVIDELARQHDLIVAVDRHEQFARWDAVVGPRTVVADDGRWRVYRVAASTPQPMAIGPRLTVQSVAAGDRNDAAGSMLDGDVRTAWSTGRTQAGDEWLLIDLGRAQDVSAVRLTQGPFTFDFPRALLVECSTDRDAWETCWRGSSTALALRAMLEDPLAGAIVVPVSARGVRYVRLRQTATDPANGWAVAELAVFGRQP